MAHDHPNRPGPPSGNGHPRPGEAAAAGLIDYRSPGAAPRGVRMGGLGVLSGVILVATIIITAVAMVAWWGDPVVRTLVLLFFLSTVAVVGAVAGMVLLWVGATRGRTSWWVAGVILGVVSMGAMVAAIAWSIRADLMAGGG